MHLHGKCINLKAFVLFMLCMKPSYAQYILEVWEPKSVGYQAVLQCDATGADFGGEISTSPVVNDTGCVYFTTPADSCEDTFNNHTGCIHYFAVVPRGNCSFSEKAYHAQRGYPDPYAALIIFDDVGHSPVPMAGSKYADRVTIPVVMISHTCMTNVMSRFSPEKGYMVALRAIPGYYDLVKYLIPLVAVVAFCFIVLCISLVVRVCRERRRLARKRLSKRNLKKLPIKKYRKGDMEESCAICIDEFVEGEKLRILPCNHAYHCKCIDPWLTKIRKVCPICKRKVLSSGESDSSDSDTERHATSASGPTATTYRENAPLLRHAEPFASGRSVVSSQGISIPRRNISDDDRPSLQVVILSSSDIPNPLPRTRVDVNSTVMRGTANSAAPSRMHTVTNNVRRTLRPYYQQFVNRSIRVPWRNMASDSNCDARPNEERPFAADNGAFDESDEAFYITQGSFAANEPPSGTEFQVVTNASPSERIAVVSGRRRHPAAASGKLTDAHLDLQVELSGDDQQNDVAAEKVCVSCVTEASTNLSKRIGNSSASSVPANLILTATLTVKNEDSRNTQASPDETETATAVNNIMQQQQ